MVLGTVAVVGIVATGGLALPGVACASTTAAASTAAGAGTSGGVVAVAAGLNGATATATAAGATATAGVNGVGVATSAVITGPVGWAVLGADEKGDQLTFDCWKPVVHDTSVEPSSGMLIKDIVCHPNIANVTMATGDDSILPHIVLENVWNENFELEFYMIKDNGRLVAHAKQIMM